MIRNSPTTTMMPTMIQVVISWPPCGTLQFSHDCGKAGRDNDGSFSVLEGILWRRRTPRRQGFRGSVHRGRRLSRRLLWRLPGPPEDRRDDRRLVPQDGEGLPLGDVPAGERRPDALRLLHVQLRLDAP